MTLKTIPVALSPEQFRYVEKSAAKAGLSNSAWVREAIGVGSPDFAKLPQPELQKRHRKGSGVPSFDKPVSQKVDTAAQALRRLQDIAAGET